VPVSADSFVRAETDMYFGHFASRGGRGRFIHLRELPLEHTGVRPNRDTLNSEAVFDLDAGPVTIEGWLAPASKALTLLLPWEAKAFGVP
jgi:hypothetical protein